MYWKFLHHDLWKWEILVGKGLKFQIVVNLRQWHPVIGKAALSDWKGVVTGAGVGNIGGGNRGEWTSNGDNETDGVKVNTGWKCCGTNALLQRCWRGNWCTFLRGSWCVWEKIWQESPWWSCCKKKVLINMERRGWCVEAEDWRTIAGLVVGLIPAMALMPCRELGVKVVVLLRVANVYL